MKMNFISTPRKVGPVPIITPITVSIHQEDREHPLTYPFSSMIDRIRHTGGCSSCGRK